jgi:hypothetical protein
MEDLYPTSAVGKKCSSGGLVNLLENSSPGMVILMRTFLGRAPAVLEYQADSWEKWR